VYKGLKQKRTSETRTVPSNSTSVLTAVINGERASNSFLQPAVSVLVLTDCFSRIYCGCCVEEMGGISLLLKPPLGICKVIRQFLFFSRMSFNALKNSVYFSDIGYLYQIA